MDRYTQLSSTVALRLADRDVDEAHGGVSIAEEKVAMGAFIIAGIGTEPATAERAAAEAPAGGGETEECDVKGARGADDGQWHRRLCHERVGL